MDRYKSMQSYMSINMNGGTKEILRAMKEFEQSQEKSMIRPVSGHVWHWLNVGAGELSGKRWACFLVPGQTPWLQGMTTYLHESTYPLSTRAFASRYGYMEDRCDFIYYETHRNAHDMSMGVVAATPLPM